MRRTSVLRRAIITGSASLAALALASRGANATGFIQRPRLLSARSWSYQLQGDLSGLINLDTDMAVVDADHIGLRWSQNVLRAKAAGGQRLLIAYLSIGEAEAWRTYWQACCAGPQKPTWLTQQTQGWDDNFAVRYWDSEWRDLTLARLRTLVEAGFDGVYLDRADTYETFAGERSTARDDMVEFIETISRTAKAINPDFAIILQNAEELLRDRKVLTSIDAIAKEDLLYGANHEPVRNATDAIASSLIHLRRAQAVGKPVFVVEYLRPGSVADGVKAEISRLGFLPLVTERSLSISDGDNVSDRASIDPAALQSR